MNPEDKEKVIEQFSNWKEIHHDYKESLDKAHEANAESVESFYASCDMTMSSLQKEVDKSRNFEEKKYYVDKMMEINRMNYEKDSENKHFIKNMGWLGLAAMTMVAKVLLSAVLGENEKIEIQNNDNLIEIQNNDNLK